MVLRLYPTTRQLYLQIHHVLVTLSAPALFSPTQFGLVCLYITGLILLDRKQTHKRMTRFLPAREHDAINRLLRVMPFSTRALFRLSGAFIKGLGVTGYLSLDDVVVPKPFSKHLQWVGTLYCSSEKRYTPSMNIVVVCWCWGRFKIPVAFRLWQPRSKVSKRAYRTKIDLAQEALIDVIYMNLPITYIVFDGWYTTKRLTKWLDHQGLIWVGRGHRKRNVVFRKRHGKLHQIPSQLKFKWRTYLNLRATAVNLYMPSLGQVRLVVTKDGHGELDFIVTNALTLDVCTLVLWKQSRWDIELVFRQSKQLAGLASCQCRAPQAVVRHVALVLFTGLVLDLLKVDPSQTTDSIKEELQLQVISQGYLPPTPLRARTM